MINSECETINDYNYEFNDSDNFYKQIYSNNILIKINELIKPYITELVKSESYDKLSDEILIDNNYEEFNRTNFNLIEKLDFSNDMIKDLEYMVSVLQIEKGELDIEYKNLMIEKDNILIENKKLLNLISDSYILKTQFEQYNNGTIKPSNLDILSDEFSNKISHNLKLEINPISNKSKLGILSDVCSNQIPHNLKLEIKPINISNKSNEEYRILDRKNVRYNLRSKIHNVNYKY